MTIPSVTFEQAVELYINTAVGRAVNLAMEISKFPQMCMRTDRASAYYGAYNAKSFEDALKAEWNRGRPVVEAEAIHGGKIKSSSMLFDQFHFWRHFLQAD